MNRNTGSHDFCLFIDDSCLTNPYFQCMSNTPLFRIYIPELELEHKPYIPSLLTASKRGHTAVVKVICIYIYIYIHVVLLYCVYMHVYIHIYLCVCVCFICMFILHRHTYTYAYIFIIYKHISHTYIASIYNIYIVDL